MYNGLRHVQLYAIDILLAMITFFTFLRQVRYTGKDVKFWLPVTE